MRFGTNLIHNSASIDKTTGAVSVPIYQVSTFHQEDIAGGQQFDYSRSGNPTRLALEETVAVLDKGVRGFAFASGMAATAAVLSTFSSGDHIVASENIYGGTYRATTTIFNRFNINTTFVDATSLEDIEKSITPETKALFLETPSNPLLKITDLKGSIEIAKKHKLLVIVDNTFMSPYLQRPLELGADVVIHSATKFIGGHSDVVGGIVVAKDEALAAEIYKIQNGLGAILGPQDCFLLLRGLKTLKIRMEYQQKNAEILANYLNNHEAIEKVYYPGLEGHPGREIHLAQADGAGAVLSIKTKSTEIAHNFMKKVKYAAVAVSLGGVETIASYPVTMSHAAMPKAEREKHGITDQLIRISVGLEDVEDLIEDFNEALKL
ncbi:MAG: PLP-dependent aspartate aminotransferase family protein [Clostridiaceae bacterium]